MLANKSEWEKELREVLEVDWSVDHLEGVTWTVRMEPNAYGRCKVYITAEKDGLKKKLSFWGDTQGYSRVSWAVRTAENVAWCMMENSRRRFETFADIPDRQRYM